MFVSLDVYPARTEPYPIHTTQTRPKVSVVKWTAQSTIRAVLSLAP
jgi:hypothetical protein